MGKHTNRSAHQSGTDRATVRAVIDRATMYPTQPMTVIADTTPPAAGPQPDMWGWTADGEWAHQIGGRVVLA